MFASGSDIELLCKNINDELIKINLWFKLNKLSLNISKRNFIVFTNRSLIGKCIDINIDGNVYETKFLGVIIDYKLNWKSHITQVRNKLNRCVSVIYKASQLLDIDSLRLLYCSLYLPYLTYCSEIWGTAYKQSIDCIMKSQKRVLRIICKTDRFSHTNDLFLRLKLLKFKDLVDYKIAIIMYRASKNDLPLNVQTYFVYTRNIYGLRQMGNFQKMHIRTTRKFEDFEDFESAIQ